ncbi:hypothetical protein EDB81DRAFT_867175 [Dactylonectria macrodidyma]|uniref:Enoyl reductase (ER) domain-containing protein n=1 Tax=Dactylonectria macrodidyma TaxID=307937 RepID=A0A9P9JDW8_9HYPO|nr:hypothetical protein EDB81DRAFT_867175 [Dactylonectria macrodidyma]
MLAAVLPNDHDILIKVLAALYRHTDAVFASEALSQELPRIGCYEFAGEVLALGPDVLSNQGIATGVRVGVPGRAYHPCGTCHECTHPSLDEMRYSPYCPYAGNFGLTRDGGYYVERVAIIGAGGGLGHLGVQFAARMGGQILAIDANDQSLELVQRTKNNLGSAGSRVHVADARKTGTDEMRLMGQEAGSVAPPTEVGQDAVILLPESQRAFDMGMKLLNNHGTMVVASFPKEKLTISAHDLAFPDISVVGSLVGRNHQLREMLEFAMQHGVSAKIKTFPFHQLNELVKMNHQGVGGKLVIDRTLEVLR